MSGELWVVRKTEEKKKTEEYFEQKIAKKAKKKCGNVQHSIPISRDSASNQRNIECRIRRARGVRPSPDEYIRRCHPSPLEGRG